MCVWPYSQFFLKIGGFVISESRGIKGKIINYFCAWPLAMKLYSESLKYPLRMSPGAILNVVEKTNPETPAGIRSFLRNIIDSYFTA
jgi:hypothetical protein